MGASSKPDLELAVVLAPASDNGQGGDFYLVHRDGPLTTVLVGDVMGKGPEAAPYAEQARQWAKECVHRAGEDPAALLEQLNTLLYSDAAFDRYATACVITINTEKRSASWAFAGHLPPMQLDTGLPLDGAAPGRPLGLYPTCGSTEAQRRPLRPREGFLLLTDGLEDVAGPGGDRFGTARVTHTLAGPLHGASPEAVVNGLKHAACEFGDGELYDDLCIIALRLP